MSNKRTGHIFIAWTNDHIASATAEEVAVEQLEEAYPDGLPPYRVKCIPVILPMIDMVTSPPVDLSTQARPVLRVVK
jgi:hypothetical protein